MNYAARFWSKVDTSAGPHACWPWTAGKYKGGYGQFCANGEGRRAQAVALELHTGEPANGRLACHSCDNPPCCNPEHLWWGTNAENIADRQRKKRQGAPRGERAGQAKLTEAQVREARKIYKPYCSVNGGAALARRFGVAQKTMSLALRGEQWGHV